jgi:hypothetical protein
LRKANSLRVFESRVLREIFGGRRDEITGEWSRLHNEELYDLYSSNIIWAIKARRMRWEGHVARMGRGEVCTGFWWGDLRERVHLIDSKWDGAVWTELIWLRIRTSGGLL